jgi:serine/threonine-protein kinase
VAAPNIGEVVAERYEVQAVLGRGGMGIVYAARNRVTGREVALKWLVDERTTSAQALQRLVREAQAAGRIHHPNVVDIYDVGEHEGSLFLVMERLYGRPLSDLFADGPVAPARLVRLLLPAMRGVAAAHRSHVVHRDLKPSNIFLCQDDRGEALEAKVLDFGISKVRADQLDGQTLSHSGAVLGTPQYMAPELFQETKAADASVDIYALGVILYRGLSGELPFTADSYAQLVHKVATNAPRPLLELCPALSKELAATVMRALAKEPRERFEDVAAFVRALEPFATPHASAMAAGEEDKLTTTPLTAAGPIEARAARGPGRLAIALLIAGVAALVGFTLSLRRAPEAPPAASAGQPAPVVAVPAAGAVAAAATPAVLTATVDAAVPKADEAGDAPPAVPMRKAPGAAKAARTPAPAPSSPRMKLTLDQF